MSSILWQEFPGINRKVAISVGFSAFGLSLGCHCGTISGVTAYISTPFGSTPQIPNFQVITPTAQDPGVQTTRLSTGPYRGYYVPTVEEISRVNEYINKENITFNSISNEFCAQIVLACENTPIWVLSDVINHRSPSRREGTSVSKEENLGLSLSTSRETTYLIGRTSHFAEYLIKNRVGYIMESPVVQNTAHRRWGNFSLNRVWLWIPPKHLSRSLYLPAQYGFEKFPAIKEWRETIFSEMVASSKTRSPESPIAALESDITAESIDKAVFDDGIFPDENRFTQTAKEA